MSRVKGVWRWGNWLLSSHSHFHAFDNFFFPEETVLQHNLSTEIHFLHFYHQRISVLLCFGNLCLKWFVPCWGSKRFWEKFPHSNILISNNTFRSILLLSFRQLEEVQSSWTEWPTENVSAAHLPLLTPFPWPQSLLSLLLRSFPGFGRIGLIFWYPGYFESFKILWLIVSFHSLAWLKL